MQEPIVEINYGKLKGRIAEDYKGEKYYSFQGIPYAKPPVGNLRFKSPQPPEKWEGILDATKLRSESLSQDFIDRSKIIGSEDCLYLNVYTPELPKNNSNLKPVMFWIHGGGYHYGSGSTDLHGPEHLITGDIVLVTFNYRLGILGFLCLEDPSLGVPGNAGMKDMVQALKWVQNNIDKFGGDPNNVTIFGESAGGASVHLLMLSPMAKGLFHRAIMQSGCAFNPWVYGKPVSKQLAEVLNMDVVNEKAILEQLLKFPADKFMEIQTTKIKDALGSNETRSFSVVIENPSSSEDNFLTQDPMEIMSSGNYNKVPVIIGYANCEALMIEIGHIKMFGSLQVPTDLIGSIPHFYNVSIRSDKEKNIEQKIKKFYFKGNEPNNEMGDEYLQLESDVLFCRGIYVTIRELVKTLNLPIYFYRITADTKLNMFKQIGKITRPGVSHCDIIGYLFTTIYTPKFDKNTIEEKCVERIVSLWTNFAKTSNPNSDNIKWIPVKKDCYNYLDIGTELTTGQNPDENRMKFWDGIASDMNSDY